MELKQICHCLPDFYQAIYIVAYFVLAYILYWVVVGGFRRYCKKSDVLMRVIDACRIPFLCILLELALFWSLTFFKFSPSLKTVIDTALFVLVAVTIGWFATRIAHGVYHHHRKEFELTGDGSMLTRALFLYRAVVIVIIMLTLASLLLIFPYIKSVGIGILGSAGIAGIAIGISAKPLLQNLIAGFMLAFMKTLKIGDGIFMGDTFGRVESIHMTHVVVRTWDLKRVVMPVSEFIEKSFTSSDLVSSELIGAVMLYCDYTVPVDVIRKKCQELIEAHPLYTGTVFKVHVTEFTEQTMQIRILMSGKDATDTFELRAYVREKLIEFLQKEYRESLPCFRYKNYSKPAEQL